MRSDSSSKSAKNSENVTNSRDTSGEVQVPKRFVILNINKMLSPKAGSAELYFSEACRQQAGENSGAQETLKTQQGILNF